MSSARIECGFCFTVPVTGFCENCQYRLCETCSKNHPRVDMFKNHNVVCNEGFTNPKEELDVDIHERNCTIHTDEKTTLYCEEHDVCLCVCCLLLEHKGCICSTIYLRNVVCDTKLPNEYISKLNEIEDKTDSIASEIEENITLIAELRSKCEKDINSFYDELIIKLVKLKKNTETEIADKYRQNTEHLENVLVSCNENRERIRQHIKHITDLVQKKHDRNLYVSLKREGITTDEFLCSNQQCRINNQVTKLTFVPNSELDKILKNDTLTFGITIDVCDGSEEVNEQNTQVLVKTPTNSDTQINVADECDDWSTTANVDKWSTAEDSAEEDVNVGDNLCCGGGKSEYREKTQPVQYGDHQPSSHMPGTGIVNSETDISTGNSMTQSQREYEHRQVSTAKARKRQKRLKKLARNFKVGNLPVEIKISVQTSMKTITLSVYGSTCIEAVKAHIENKVGLPKAQQRLRFAGNYLQDDLCISDYNIQNNSTLYLA